MLLRTKLNASKFWLHTILLLSVTKSSLRYWQQAVLHLRFRWNTHSPVSLRRRSVV